MKEAEEKLPVRRNPGRGLLRKERFSFFFFLRKERFSIVIGSVNPVIQGSGL